MKSPNVKVITANIGGFKMAEALNRLPDTIVNIIRTTHYPDLVLLQETNWVDSSLQTAQQIISNSPYPGGRHYTLLGSTAGVSNRSVGVGLVYSDNVTITNFTTVFEYFPALDNRLCLADVHIKGTDRQLSLINVYAPNEQGASPFTNRQFYQSLDDYLRLHPCQYPLIAAGDWNAVASNDGRIGEKVTTHLKDFLANWDLLDTYTLISKHRKGLYTHTNNSRGAGRRLDQLHISSTLSQWIKSTQLVTNKQGHNITKSSHHAVQFVFNFGNLTQRQDRGPGTWRMPWWVFDTEYIAWLKFHVKSILKRYGPLKPSLKLQCLKENIKVTIQQEAKNRALRDSNHPDNRRREALMATASDWQAYPANEPYPMLHARVEQSKQQMEIHSLRNHQGRVKTDTSSLCDISARYFDNIFDRAADINDTDDSAFLDLFPEETRRVNTANPSLDSSFTKEEIFDTIKASTHNSAPGPDGIPYRFYRDCWDELGDLMTDVYNEAGADSPISTERNTAIIKLLYKSGDQADISNYRPISLINTEVKIYTQLINKAIQNILPDSIHGAQNGFVPGRHITNNLDTMDHFCNAYSQLNMGWVVGSLDFRKAYDTISQSWVIKTLRNVGVSELMINRILAVQQNAVTRINIRGVLSRPVRIKIGVRQGCPLSPTLFIIAVDALVRRLDREMFGLAPGLPLSHHHTTGHRPPQPPTHPEAVAAGHMKVSAFADDIAVFLNNIQDVATVGRVLCLFQRVSGLTLNPSKTVLQKIGPPDCFVPLTFIDAEWQRTIDATWPTDNNTRQAPTLRTSDNIFRYLGVHFGNRERLDTHYAQIKEDLKESLRRLSLWGLPYYSKAWMINIYFFSKLNFLGPYVSQIDNTFIRELNELACDKINKLSPDKTRKTFSNGFIQTPVGRGGLNLRDMGRFMVCLKAARAYRFFHGSSPALWDCTFQFYSRTHSLTQEKPHQRVDCRFPTGQAWGYAASPTMRDAIRASFELNKPLTAEHANPREDHEPSTTDTVNHRIWERNQVNVRAAESFREAHVDIAAARRYHPVRMVSTAEIDHLRWSMGPLTLKNFMFHKTSSPDLPNFPHTLARPKKWTQRSDYGGIADDMVWQEVMHDLRKHYIADANKAQVLHLMRISRLPLVKWRYPDDHVFTKKNPGCGLCDKAIIQDLHEHIFCKCEVLLSMLTRMKIPSVDSLKDWIFTESKCGVLPSFPGHVNSDAPRKHQQVKTRKYLRELAYGIWKMERSLRYSGDDATLGHVQQGLLQFLKEAQMCFYDGQPPALHDERE